MAVRGIKMTKKVKNDHPFYQIWNKQKKGTKTFFCKSIILELTLHRAGQGYQARKRTEIFFREKNGQKMAKNALKHIFWSNNCFPRN